MDKRIILLFTALLAISCVSAKVKLPSVFTDHMVLQQQTVTKIWGKADGGRMVELVGSWDNKTYTVKSDEKGYFEFEVTTPAAGGPYTIQISDGEPLILNDVLIGEVWFCSGQSNMEMPVKGYRGQPVYGSHPYIVSADEKRPLRLFTVGNAWSKEAKDDVEGHWSLSSPKEVSDFSAVAYFFGNLLQEKLQVPVGLINCSWSASKIEAWMSRETLDTIPEVDLSVLKNTEFGYPNGTPTLLHNAMVQPLHGICVKGILWYQGEANSNAPALYKKLFPAFVQQWRNFFHSPGMPFYYVQIAPWQSGNKDELDWALFRECQLELMSEVPNTGMVITADAGSEKFIHPPYKIKVGERLAYWALAKTYGIDGFAYSGPVYQSYTLKDNMAELTFDYAADGLNPEKELLDGFEIAGKDGVFVEAKAEVIEGSGKVRVWSELVSNPVEIRYCFRNYKIGNLTNNAGLPASPFRVKIK
ncbi:sialate O-acetylesterase [Dysgonomonas sp. 521]|uniref:sialate O-acetylesterase n=1 Tax=Dysgonomonas sp. 521 TaxID=2302932 RepID=UPI0013CFC92F|nr:sialate O-acetylesterase [Dysgonomonas sp. 521]NDV96360.1 sialate O-acetylesterase [Dysgonomonas sp. 521]